MSKILDEFNYELHCPFCEETTEHCIQKIEEECVGFYSECDVCNNTREVKLEELRYYE